MISVLFHKSNSNRRRFSSMSLGISIYLAFLFGFSPILQVLHLKFASHEHHFCLKHFRIEDVFHKQKLQEKFAEVEKYSSFSPIEDSDPQEDLHIACPVLNHLSSKTPILPNDICSSLGLDQVKCQSLVSNDDSVFITTVFLFAPKTSPPNFG